MSKQLEIKKVLKTQFPLLAMLSLVGIVSLMIGWGVSSWLSRDTSPESSSPSTHSEILTEFLHANWNDPQGQAIDTHAWGGKTLVINFWASWCPPCVEEMPLLAQLSKSSDVKNVLFIGIGIDTPSNIRQFTENRPAPYPIVVGGLEGSNWAKRWGNTQGALPFTVIISPNGKVVYSKLGKVAESDVQNALAKGSL